MQNNIKVLRKRKGLSQEYIGNILGVSQPTMVAFEQGRRDLTDKQKEQLASILNVTIDDLFTSNLKIKSNNASIDMLDTIACCGNGNEDVFENVIGHWIMPVQEFKTISLVEPNQVKLIRVKGDSMEPTLRSGDWVMVDTTYKTPDSDGLFLISMSTGLAVKRIQGSINNIIVKSDNPNYADITAEVGEIKIVGKVIYTLSAKNIS